MSQPWQTYFSGDSQITSLNSAISSNATDTSLVALYTAGRANLFSAIATAEATAIATPNQTNLDALAAAIVDRDTKIAGQAFAASLADQLVNGPAGTIMTRTVSLVVAALQDAIVKVNAQINSIGYSGSVTQTNAASRDLLARALVDAQSFLNNSSQWQKPADVGPAIAWLVS